MNFPIRKILFLSGILCLTGLLVCFGIWCALDFDFTRLDTVGSKSGTIDLSQHYSEAELSAVDHISVNSGSCDVTLHPASDNKFRVVYNTSAHITVTVSVDGDRLVVIALDTSDRQPWYKHIRLQIRKHTGIAVYVPKGIYESITTTSQSGNISLSGWLTADTLNITTTSGDVDARVDTTYAMNVTTDSGDVLLSNLSGKNLIVRTGSGDVRMSHSTLRDNVKLLSSSGDIRVEHAELPHTLTLNTASGDCSMTDVTVSRLNIATRSGEVRLTDSEMQYLNTETSSGDIRLNNCGIVITADLSATSGDITCVLKGLHKVYARTHSGDIDIQRHKRVEKALCNFKISTHSGDISLK